MACRRRTSSSFCCSAPLPKYPISFHLKSFVHRDMYQIRRGSISGKFLGDSTLSGGSVSFSAQFRRPLRPLRFFPFFIPRIRSVICYSGRLSSLKIFGSPARRAPPLTRRTSSYFAAGDFPCHLNRLFQMLPVIVVHTTSLHEERGPPLVSVLDDYDASVNRRRRRMEPALLGLGQVSRFLFWRMSLVWAGPICCSGLLSLLGCKIALCCKQVYSLFVHQTPSSSDPLCLPFWHPFAISCVFTQRFTGYFSGLPLPTPDTSPTCLICFRSRTTLVGSDSAQFRRRLLTGYFSGISLPASKVVPGCSQPRTTFAGSNFNGSSVWCFVTSILIANSPIVLSALVADSISEQHNTLCVLCCPRHPF